MSRREAVLGFLFARSLTNALSGGEECRVLLSCNLIIGSGGLAPVRPGASEKRSLPVAIPSFAVFRYRIEAAAIRLPVPRRGLTGLHEGGKPFLSFARLAQGGGRPHQPSKNRGFQVRVSRRLVHLQSATEIGVGFGK